MEFSNRVLCDWIFEESKRSSGADGVLWSFQYFDRFQYAHFKLNHRPDRPPSRLCIRKLCFSGIAIFCPLSVFPKICTETRYQYFHAYLSRLRHMAPFILRRLNEGYSPYRKIFGIAEAACYLICGFVVDVWCARGATTFKTTCISNKTCTCIRESSILGSSRVVNLNVMMIGSMTSARTPSRSG